MAPKSYDNIIYEKKTPIAYVILNRPEKLNALSGELQSEVLDVLNDAGWEDDKIRVIVLKGAGRCFSSGFDIGTSSDLDALQFRNFMLRQRKRFHAYGFWDVFWNNPKPLIAQVHGFCLAGGMATASFCDLCICSEDALFGYPFVREGGPYLAATWPWLLGMRKTRELMYTGNLISAQEALSLGLVNKVVPRNKLEEEVNALAQTIAKVPLSAVELGKKAINMAYEMMGIRLTIERSSELDSICLASPKSISERAEFIRIRGAKGLKAALEWRKKKFAEEDAWWSDKTARPAKKRKPPVRRKQSNL